jgi:hypothetical protein
MRVLVKWEMGLEAGNEAIRSGRIAEFNRSFMERLRPEAAYYGTENGRRTGYLFCDLADPAQIPVIAEPLFQELCCTVEFIPVMNADDLQRGLAAWASSPARHEP